MTKDTELKLELIDRMLDKTPYTKESGLRIRLTKKLLLWSFSDLYILAMKDRKDVSQ